MTDKDPPILLDTIQQNMSFKKGYYNSETSQPALQNACLCIPDTAYNNCLHSKTGTALVTVIAW